jgi:membrane protein
MPHPDRVTHAVASRLDRLQRRHPALGFSYGVIRKYGDDACGREAALITYYGFLSVFPILLLAVATVSWVLAESPDLRQRLVDAMVPHSLQPSVESAAAGLPRSPAALVAGLVGLLYTATGVVLSAYRTLNHLAAVPVQQRAGFASRTVRVLVVLILLLVGTVGVGVCTVAAAAVPRPGGGARVLAALGSCLIVFAVLLFGARLLLDRPAPLGAIAVAALPGAVVVTLMLSTGAVVLPELVRRAGVVYGGFATVAGIFTVLYLVSQALVGAAEIAAVRYAGLWPRALDRSRPTEADARALMLIARAVAPPDTEACLSRRACAEPAGAARPGRP